MAYNAEHLFICLLVICKCGAFSDLLHRFKIEFIFLLLIFNCSLYILANRPLSDVSFANTFSQSVACILIIFMVSFAETKF